MSGKSLQTYGALRLSPGSRRNASASVVAVGDPGEWAKQENILSVDGIRFIAFSEVNSEMLEHLNPTTIYSPVLARSFDCIELATLLQNLGFAGAYRAFAKRLPKPELIEREVRELCNRLDFRIFVAR